MKMYIADFVFRVGSPEDVAAAATMLRNSDDRIATDLYRKYPASITDTASRYGLTDTKSAPHWGNSTTSTYDSVKFLEAKKRENPGDLVLINLAQASPRAADGYRQDFGTAHLPGVIGTKFGWSDDHRSYHATASYGVDFSVAAQINGTADQLTETAHGAFETGAAPSPLPLVPFGADGMWEPIHGLAQGFDDALQQAGSSEVFSATDAAEGARRDVESGLLQLSSMLPPQ
ncbi:hypothetical protein [Corynebacterium tapiri]|uniref:Uncharacterized protein n=1 Tax=Corynebacterium tapiri TaxID=1448266 RepID=A0A5C4U545_9CORY|nr:hypothetical protein FHE74_02720 [Corynebacterium tapiri]